MKTRSKARSCTGKRRHDSHAQARKHIERLAHMLGAPADRYHFYDCQHCGGIHVGHHSGKPRRTR